VRAVVVVRLNVDKSEMKKRKRGVLKGSRFVGSNGDGSRQRWTSRGLPTFAHMWLV